MRILFILFFAVLAGCASYVTPGGPVRLDAIDREDIAEAAARKPAAIFPARIAIARVQAPDYRSYTTDPLVVGRYSVITTQELLTEVQFDEIVAWPKVAGVAPISRLLLPEKLESLDDLRLAAAKLQADVLLVYTLDTSFRIQGRGYGPLTPISLGLVPDRDAHITTTASAILTDVRTGFVYGVAEATAKTAGLTNVWGASDTVDRKRLEAEGEAFKLLLAEATKTWRGVVKQHGR